MSQPAITPRFSPGQIVTHITDETFRGCIVAFMVRGNNHSYQVQWGVEKELWHLDYELKAIPEAPPREIGFWAATP